MSFTTKYISVLIPDGESDMSLVLQVVYCLSSMKNFKVYIMSSKRRNFVKYSRGVTRFIYCSQANEEDWIKTINNVVYRYSIDIIMPVYTHGIEKILKFGDQIKDNEKICPLPSLTSYNLAGNKGNLYLHLIKNNIPCPKSKIIKNNTLPKIVNLKFPIIAKPVVGGGGGAGISILKNNEDLLNYIKKNHFDCDIIIQQFVSGFNTSVNVLCIKGEIIAHSIQKENRIEKLKLTPQTDFSFIKDDSLFELIERLMKSLDWCGVANIDCIYDEKENTFKIIEINPRFWINVDASAIAGVNFPYILCSATLKQKMNSAEAINMSYQNLKGLVRVLKKNPMKVLNANSLRRNTPLVFALKDPLPIIYKFIWRTQNIFNKRFNKVE